MATTSLSKRPVLIHDLFSLPMSSGLAAPQEQGFLRIKTAQRGRLFRLAKDVARKIRSPRDTPPFGTATSTCQRRATSLCCIANFYMINCFL